MQFSQSKVSSRGPLIAVIKIQLSANNTDRIYLHQNDDDYALAQQFQKKHHLKPHLVHHIQKKIQLSRASINQTQNYKKQYQQPSRGQIQSNYQEKKNNEKFVPTLGQHSTYGFLEYQSHNNQQTTYFPNFGNQTFEQSPKQQEESQLFRQAMERVKQQKQLYGLVSNQQVKKQLFKQSRSSDRQQQPLAQNFRYTNINNLPFTLVEQKRGDYSFQQAGRSSKVKMLGKQQLIQMRQSMKRSLSKSQISKINREVTNRLYNEQQIKKKYLKKIKQQANHDKSQDEVKQCTYRPQINSHSNLLAQQRLKDKTVFDHLIEKGKKVKNQKQYEKNLEENKDIAAYSFQPQINHISKRLTADKPPTFMRSTKSLKKIPTGPTFKPQINKTSEQLVRNLGNFDQRMKTFLQSKNLKLSRQAQQKKTQQKVDLVSGQQLFKPKISQFPTKNRDIKGSNVGDYLFELSKKQRVSQSKANHIKINDNSQQIVKQMYLKRLAWLFSQLDSDQDGWISANKICIQTISQDLLQIIMPVLIQMQQMQIELSLPDFRDAIKNLHPSLTALQKSILYDYKKKN